MKRTTAKRKIPTKKKSTYRVVTKGRKTTITRKTENIGVSRTKVRFDTRKTEDKKELEGYLYVEPYVGDRYVISQNKKTDWKTDVDIGSLLKGLEGKKIKITVEVLR